MTKNYLSDIQKLLFEHPLYNWLDEKEENMSVLVVGYTEEAVAFVDLCLQVGQMIDKKLEVYWCLPDLEKKKNYLETRPALKDFVSIDSEAIDDPYAHLFFYEQERYLDSFAEKCRYIFAATDDKKMNEETASLFKQASVVDCLAACLGDGEIIVSFNGDPDSPEFIEKKKAEAFFDTEGELERMAFNTHCIWNGGGNVNIQKVREDFDDEYNYNSSVAFVLSIPYKLRSVGIADSNIYNAAATFNQLVKKADNNMSSNEAHKLSVAAYLEHRRWVIEKAINGVEKLDASDFSACIANGSLKMLNSQGKLSKHQCLLRSTENTPLSDGTYNHEDWDAEKSDKDIQLDELDKMSIDLHRVMKKHADALKTNTDYLNGLMSSLESLCIGQGDEAERDFNRYKLCFENILDHSEPHAAQMDRYESALKGRLDDNARQEGEALIEEIRKILFPVLEYCMYRDYKKNDIDLVVQIPTILTKKINVHICAPLGETSSAKYCNDENFRSVASATALTASKVTYIHILEQTTNCELLYSKMKAINKFFEYREADCSINLIAFIKTGKNTGIEIGKRKKEYNKVLERVKRENLVEKLKTITYEDEEALAEGVISEVKQLKPDYFDGTNPVSISSSVNGRIISRFIQRDRDAQIPPYFEFDSSNKEFKVHIDCDELQYPEITSFICVEDMFALMNAQDKEFNYEDYADSYMDYWDICRGKAIHRNNMLECVAAWNILCDSVYNYFDQNYYKRQIDAAQEDDGSFRVELKINKKNSRQKDIIKEMLEKLQKRGDIIITASQNKTDYSIVINNDKAKQVLEKGGKALELYVYYEVCKTDWFDDVQSSYYFRWEHEDVENELDCVITKGYKSMIIECKTSNTYKFDGVNIYPKLDSLSNHFGINCKKVLVWPADTSYRKYPMHKARGAQLDIITISERDALEDIGNELIKIMEQ